MPSAQKHRAPKRWPVPTQPLPGVGPSGAPDVPASMTAGTPSETMRQAYRDLARGLQDNDRGAEAGRTYRKLQR